jgi:peptidylprolyl isomerase
MLRFAFAGAFGFAYCANQQGVAHAKRPYLPAYPTVENNSIVFLDFETSAAASWFGGGGGPKPLGRVEIELFDDTVPITARNFRSLCKGDMGLSPSGKKLHYKNSVVHRCIPGFMVQFGDIDGLSGRGGCSIYGMRFKDESFKGKAGRHLSPGMLSMANCGPHTNGSQAFITFDAAPHLDGRHVVFGQVLKGFDVVEELERLGSPSGAPSGKIIIKDSGVIRETPVTPIKMGYGS